MHAVLIGLFVYLWFRRRRRRRELNGVAKGDVKMPSLAGGRSGLDAGAAVAQQRASSIIGPSPSATLIKASESLSFTTGDGSHAHGSTADPTDTAGRIAILSSLARTPSAAGDPTPDAADGSGAVDASPPLSLWTSAAAEFRAQGTASTLAASAAPRSVGAATGGLGSVGGPASSSASIGAPASSEYRPYAANGGQIGADELKIFDVLDRSRDSAVYQGPCVWSRLRRDLL